MRRTISITFCALVAGLVCADGLLPAPARVAGASTVRGGGGHTIRVMTYNIRVGIGMDKKFDLARTAAVIKRERPDLVGLQEVDRGVERTGRRDEIAELAQLTGMEYAFAPNLRYQGGWYGVAILSRFPILSVDHRRYANLREAERRGLLRVEVSVNGERLGFVTTHLDYQHEDGRLFETRQLLGALEALDTPLIVSGDFNDEPSGSSYKLLLTRFADAWTESRAGGSDLTYPSDKPVKRIDYVFYDRRARRLRARRARILQTQASDHLPLVVDFELLSEGAPPAGL